MKRLSVLAVLLFLCCALGMAGDGRCSVSLYGEWSFCLDADDEGLEKGFWDKKFQETVLLPGTTDSNRKGMTNTDTVVTANLSRYYRYEGPAWYSKEVEIPSDWADRHIELFLERTRPTMVWVDGKPVGRRGYLSTPHIYDLSDALSPGKHRITVRVDNGESIPSKIRSSSHACSESTQTNWNGIIGKIELRSMEKLHISSVNVYPDLTACSVKVKVALSENSGLEGKMLRLSAEAFNTKNRHIPPAVTCPLEEGKSVYLIDYPLGGGAVLWSDEDPGLYRLSVGIPEIDNTETVFGFREFKADGRHFTINGRRTFLRGKHDACVFPLTGYTAMGLDEWRHYFKVCKEYGINHCRFHSWCPPRACFEAADLEGIYLQPELPVWGSFRNDDVEFRDFLLDDGDNIQREYSNHASFVMFALGNELSGDSDMIEQFVAHFRRLEDRHLYAYGSNNYLGTKGCIPGEDFLVTCRVGKGEGYDTHSRASFSFADADEGGYLNNTYPNTEMTFDAAALRSSVPVVGHETGQFQIYPDYSQIGKYTGVLAPWNLEIFHDRLEKAGLAGQAEDFFRASGAWAVELYKADIEMNLRSEEMAGFQLLDLQDYPGQGSAYVGILDAFMDSKGLIAPAEWRKFCSGTVPLLIMGKYCWTGGETFSGKIKIANYSGRDFGGKHVSWKLSSGGKVWSKGSLVMPEGYGLLTAGNIEFSLPDVGKAVVATLHIRINGTEYSNGYKIWVYPRKTELDAGEVTVATRLDSTVLSLLENGAKVLLLPEREHCRDFTVGGLFCTDYWNYRMFKNICEGMGRAVSPGTLGILTDPDHPIFDDFPTDFHTDWQWYPVIKASYPMILDGIDGIRPIVRVIDNVERNHSLGLVYELTVGKGRLLVCMADLEAAKATPEGLQFYASLLRYMNSSSFSPDFGISAEELEMLFSKSAVQAEIGELKNISYE